MLSAKQQELALLHRKAVQNQQIKTRFDKNLGKIASKKGSMPIEGYWLQKLGILFLTISLIEVVKGLANYVT